MESRTKHILQKHIVRKIVGKRLYPKIKFLKIYYKAKLGTKYEISDILLKVLKKDDVFFDVGANLGQYIIRILSRFKSNVKIFAFEPVLANFNILSNYITKNCNTLTLENLAVSDVNGVDVLYIPLIGDIEIDTQASIDYANRRNYYDEFTNQDIKTVTIDSYVLEKNILKMDFLKIDTEGNDEKVINGALKSISDFKPVIFCEDMEGIDTLELLSKLGYRRFILRKDYKLISFSKAKSADVFNDLIIFIPEEKIHIFDNYIVN